MAEISPERWRRLAALFDEAMKLAPEQRADFLASACGEDDELKRLLSDLLSASGRADGFLDEPLLSNARSLLSQLAGGAAPISASDIETDVSGAPTLTTPAGGNRAETVGPYKLLEKIGEGGMGEVWRAEQSEPIRREVAVKVIKAGMQTKQVIARFEAERQALALMSHPGIAKVFDAGETSSGLPYFAMEYVAGEPITLYCDRHRLSTTDRIDLFVQVCEAIQHAHQKGVIHRDLKPTNVLVAIVGDEPQPKVIDFGVAKATAQKLTERTLFTELGVLVGTPEYMSPEQAEMTGLDVDTRTDVYSLGVMLYELLTGSLPFESRELRQGGYEEIRRRIREVEPPRPSTKVRTLGDRSTEAARSRQTDPVRLASALRGDLDWIVMKSLEKDRTRRYGSPSELSADLDRHLKNEPVLAGPPGTTYRARKFVRRHRFGVAAASLAVTALLAFGVMMAVEARAIARERDRAEQVSEFLVNLFQVSDPSEARGNSITAREVLDRGAKRIEEDLKSDPLERAQMMATMGNVYLSLGLASKAESLFGESIDLRSRWLGQDHPETLRIRSLFGRAAEDQGHYKEAEQRTRQALESQRRVLGSENPDTLASVHELGHVLDYLGKYEEMEKCFREAYESRLKVLGPDNRDTLLSQSLLGVALERLGRFSEALEVHRQVLAGRRRALGEDHPDTFWSLNNIGGALAGMGKYAEAESYFRQAYQGLSHVLGEDHPDTIFVKNNVANQVSSQGRLDEAASMYREILESRRRVLGPEHPRTLGSMSNLATLLSEQGHNAEAEKTYKEVLEIQLRVLGNENPATLITMNNLASVYSDTGRIDEAEPLFRRIWETAQKTRGPEHPVTLGFAANLVSVWADQGRLAEAESLCRKTLEQQRRVEGADHPDTLQSVLYLASIEVRKGDRRQGLEILRQAVDAGYADLDNLAKDRGFQSLKNDPEFERLSRLVAKKAQERSGGAK